MSFLSALFSKQLLYIFSISILPVIELRGAIILAAAWDLPILGAYFAALLGNLLPIPFDTAFCAQNFKLLKRSTVFFALRLPLRRKNRI